MTASKAMRTRDDGGKSQAVAREGAKAPVGPESAEALRSAILALSSALDPHRQGIQWPDPIAWDGRQLREQAADLLGITADHGAGLAWPDGTDDYCGASHSCEDVSAAADAIRAALAAARGGAA